MKDEKEEHIDKLVKVGNNYMKVGLSDVIVLTVIGLLFLLFIPRGCEQQRNIVDKDQEIIDVMCEDEDE